MPNFEKYNKLHDEIMKRLEAGEITTEQAKEVNNLVFEKYITEGEISSIVLTRYKKSTEISDDRKEKIKLSIENGSYNGRNVWITDLAYADVSKEDIKKIANKGKGGLQKEWLGYVKSWIEEDDPNEYQQIQKKFEKTDITILAHDGGGTEFGIDKNTLKIYLFDHDDGLLKESLSISSFLSLIKKVINK